MNEGKMAEYLMRLTELQGEYEMPRKVYLYNEDGKKKYVSAQNVLSSGEVRFFVANWYKKEKDVKVTLEEDDGTIIKEFDVKK